MKKIKVIDGKNIRTRPSFAGYGFWLLLMDYLHAPGWVWGMGCTVLGIMFILQVILMWNEVPVDIFEEKK